MRTMLIPCVMLGRGTPGADADAPAHLKVLLVPVPAAAPSPVSTFPRVLVSAAATH